MVLRHIEGNDPLDSNEGIDMAQVMLIAVDAEDTQRVAAAGHQWANDLGLRPLLVHAVPDPPTVPSGDERLRDQAKDPAREVLELAGADHPATKRRLVYGSPADAILDAAGDEGAQLIVTGSRGAGTIRALLTGSVSRELVKAARVPVMVLPSTPVSTGEAGVGNLHSRPSVICGVATPERPDQCLATAAAICDHAELDLTLTHVRVPVEAPFYTDAGLAGTLTQEPAGAADREERERDHLEQAVAEAQAAVRSGEVNVRTHVLTGDPAQEVRTLASRTAARLIVVGANGKGALEASFLGSVSQDLLGTSPTPVLVVPPGTALVPTRAHLEHTPAA